MKSVIVRTAGSAAILLGLLAVPANAEVRQIESACPEWWAVSFADVPPDNVHARAVECVAAWAIAKGTSDDSYSPERTVTRAQMASFIAKTIVTSDGYLDPEAPDAFDDDDGNTHEISINALASVGIVSGVGDRAYGPGGPVSRAQMATFLVRAFEYVASELPSGSDAFGDDDGNPHEHSINKASQAGFLAGTSPTTYSAARAVRRDAMASFIARMLDKLVAEGYIDGPQEGEPTREGTEPEKPPAEPDGTEGSGAQTSAASTSSEPSGSGEVTAAGVTWYDYGKFQCQGVTTPQAYGPNVSSTGYVAWIPEFIWYLPDGSWTSAWGQWLWSNQGSQWQYFSSEPFYPPPAYTGHLAVRNWVYDYDTGEWWNSWSTTAPNILGHGGGEYYCYFNAWGLIGAERGGL